MLIALAHFLDHQPLFATHQFSSSDKIWGGVRREEHWHMWVRAEAAMMCLIVILSQCGGGERGAKVNNTPEISQLSEC